MLRLPSRFAEFILTFAPLFLQRGWRHAGVLLAGTTLAPGRRTMYRKQRPAFSDMRKLRPTLRESTAYALCHAA